MSLQQAIILAGGQGTRLRERLGDLPKPLIDVAGIPLLERQILLLKRYGYRRIIILVNYKAEKIEQFCNSHANWELQISCVDDGEPRGTAGAVLNIYDCLDDEFLVVYGDTMLEVDIGRFEAAHTRNKDSAGTIFLHPNDHPQDSDLVEMDEDGRITVFHAYPHPSDHYLPNLVNAALYILNRDALKPWRQAGVQGIFDFGKHLFPELLASGQRLYGYNSPEYIKDCGTPARLDKITQHLISGKVERSSLAHKQPAIFLDRDGTINKEVHFLKSADQLELLDGVEEAIRAINQSAYRTCIITNQPVVARGECSFAELKNIHNKLETLLGRKGAFVDRIYVCPHHPDSGFIGEIAELKVSCACRKPNTGLVDRAEKELNIDLERSWLIGDTTTDIETARRAGLRSILVETGYAGLDLKYNNTADFTFPSLPMAVQFILDIYPQACIKANQLLAHVLPGQVILIGGQARSGKSSTSMIMKMVLKAQGKRAHVISTDRWLLPEQERRAGVLGIHNLQGLHRICKQLAQPRCNTIALQLPVHVKNVHVSTAQDNTLEIMPSDIVILEGVVALSLSSQLPQGCHKFATVIDERERRTQLMNEYLRNSDNDQESQVHYQKHIQDEYEEVMSIMTQAQLIDSLARIPTQWTPRHDY